MVWAVVGCAHRVFSERGTLRAYAGEGSESPLRALGWTCGSVHPSRVSEEILAHCPAVVAPLVRGWGWSGSGTGGAVCARGAGRGLWCARRAIGGTCTAARRAPRRRGVRRIARRSGATGRAQRGAPTIGTRSARANSGCARRSFARPRKRLAWLITLPARVLGPPQCSRAPTRWRSARKVQARVRREARGRSKMRPSVLSAQRAARPPGCAAPSASVSFGSSSCTGPRAAGGVPQRHRHTGLTADRGSR